MLDFLWKQNEMPLNLVFYIIWLYNERLSFKNRLNSFYHIQININLNTHTHIKTHKNLTGST